MDLPGRAESDRPEDGTRKALEWDYTMGLAYKNLTEHRAWQDLVGQLFAARDNYYAVLRSGEGNQDGARAGITLVEWVLRLPAEMIVRGEESEQDIRRVAEEGKKDE